MITRRVNIGNHGAWDSNSAEPTPAGRRMGAGPTPGLRSRGLNPHRDGLPDGHREGQAALRVLGGARRSDPRLAQSTAAQGGSFGRLVSEGRAGSATQTGGSARGVSGLGPGRPHDRHDPSTRSRVARLDSPPDPRRPEPLHPSPAAARPQPRGQGRPPRWSGCAR